MKKLFFLLFTGIFVYGCSGTDVLNGNNDEITDSDIVPEVINLQCSSEYEKYESPDTPIKLCYLPAWGDVITEEFAGATGKKTKISFSEIPTGPQIIYQTIDYTPPQGKKEVDFSGLNVYTNDDVMLKEVSTLLNIPADKLKVRKNAVSLDNRAVRVRIQTDELDELRYYIPEAFEGYRMILKSNGEMAGELDELAFDILF